MQALSTKFSLDFNEPLSNFKRFKFIAVVS